MLTNHMDTDGLMFADRYVKETKMIQPFRCSKTDTELWTEHFKEFVKTEGKEALFYWIYDSYYKEHTESEKILKEIMNTFRRLKRNSRELYEEVMTPDFLNMLLFHASSVLFRGVSSQMRTNFTSWLGKELKGKPKQEDMWNVLEKMYGDEDSPGDFFTLGAGLDMFKIKINDKEKIMDFMSAWKNCFSTEIEVDMAECFQKQTVFCMLNLSTFRFPGLKAEVEKVLDIVSYFHNSTNDSETEIIADNILHELSDREIMYRALRKNLIPAGTAYELAKKVLSEENDKYEYMPMLIMKIHEE